MFARHPLSGLPERLDERGLVDALRLAIIAELDAISFYEQVARAAPSEEARRLFADVAREERTHVGEFLSLLLKLDPGQAEELARGYREAAELLGGRGVSEPPLPGGASPGSPAAASGNPGSSGAAAGDPPGSGFEERVAEVFRRALEGSRVLLGVLPATRLGEGVDYAVAVRPGLETDYIGVEAEVLVPLEEHSVEFVIPERVAARARRLGVDAYAPLVVEAARRLALSEERAVLNALLAAEGRLEERLGSWERPGEAVEDVARAVAALEAEGARGPYAVVVSPRRYARLLVVHEKSGVAELSRVERFAKVIRHPLLGDDKVVVVSLEPALIDVVYGAEGRVEYLGAEAAGHRFRAWESLGLRVQVPSAAVAVLTTA